MKRKSSLFLAFTLLASSLVMTPSVEAKELCKVTDPTGTALNVRAKPNGSMVIDSRPNNSYVYLEEEAIDDQGRYWAKIGLYISNKYYPNWGWVYKEFITCNYR